MTSGVPQKRKRVLTAKQLRFIEEYQTDLNATQAAIRSGYSRRRAGEIGYQLLQKTTIQQAIQAKQEDLARQLGVTRERIVREAACIAVSDVRKLFDESDALRPIHDIDEDTAAAIASSKIKPEYEFRNGKKVLVGYSQEVRFWDKNAALEKLMKYLGMFAKDNPQRSSDAIAALLAAIDGKSARLTCTS